MFRQTRYLGICAGCALVCATAAAGQSAGDAAGSIDGTVRDASGAVLSQVVVRAVGPALMGAREDVSRDDGFYRIPALAPGDYELTFTRAGFEQAIRRDVRVRSGATTTISITLTLEALRENVIVGPNASAVDRRGTSLAAVMDAQELSDLPGSRTVNAILSAAPGIQFAGFDVGGNTALAPRGGFSGYGFPGYNRPTLEGIDISQHLRFAFPLDYGSFDQAWVGLGAYGSQLPSPGVHVQVLAKSGGERYRGSLYAGYQSGDWQARNIDPGQVARGAAGGMGLSARDVNRQDGYQDVNADIGGFFVRSSWWWYASVRDQRVSARVVSFPVSPIDTSATIGSVKTTIRTGSNGTLVLYTHPAIARQPIHLGAFLRGEAVNLSTDSTSNREARGLVWKAEWSAPLSASLLASARVGQFVVRREDLPRASSPRFEDLATPAVDGGNRTWRESLQRTHVSGSLGYLYEGRGGRHQLTAGGESLHAIAAETWYQSYAGDVLHVLRAGAPAEVYLFQTPSESRSGQWWHSASLSDSWYAHDRLTINGGLRYDRFRLFLPAQQHPTGRFNATPQTFAPVDRLAVWNAVSPRIGASFDPVGNGRTLIKSSYGIYRLPPGTDVAFNANPNAPVWWEHYEWTDSNVDRLWQPGEEGLAPLERRGGIALESLDADLELGYVREATAHVERDFGAVNLSTGVIWRGERQQGLRQLSDRSFEMFTVSTILRDPGPGGTTLAPGADGPAVQVFDVPNISLVPSEPVVGNVARSNSDYTTWEVTAARRFTDRWSLAASFAHTWNRDHASGYLGQAVRTNEYAVTPNDLINTDEQGRHVFRTWAAKAHGTWMAPWGLRVTPLVRYQSGQPFGRTVLARLNVGTVRVLAEPIGTRRQDSVTLVDLGARKDFVLRGGRRASVFVEVFNLFNVNPEQTVSWASGPSFLRPLSIVPPRIARVGIRMDW
ncbi:MAG TPA: carboxypeptidase regulatory-like domain-containing protein [Vicinamibacterales bacterium]|nr:carboxypeptidase regulatory-like domain-containing protein [Vicinamibacterales bacterium]